MKIEKRRLDEIHPYAGNAKLHPAEQVEQIKKSIEQFGNNDPIAVDEEGVIIEGHGRYLALKELGYDEAEVIVLYGMTEDEKNAYRLVHNQLTMNSGFDLELLEEELKAIDIDLEDYGFSTENGQDFIEDMLGDNYMDHDLSLQHFDVTLTFPIEEQESVQGFIKTNGKDFLVEHIIKLCKGEE